MNFFSALIDNVQLIIEYIINASTMAYRAILLITSLIPFPSMIGAFLPSIIGSSMIIVVFVGVVKLILGWSGEA